jgi:hypothetical protein
MKSINQPGLNLKQIAQLRQLLAHTSKDQRKAIYNGLKPEFHLEEFEAWKKKYEEYMQQENEEMMRNL